MGPVIKRLSKDKTVEYYSSLLIKSDKKDRDCLNKDTKSIISIFAGRMSDKGVDPLPILKKHFIM